MVTRYIMSVLGGLFSMLTLGVVMGALTLGAIFYMYGQDLPTPDTLSSYTPKTVSRIYDGEGDLLDEYAVERRLFTPIEEIPDVVIHAFISAEDKDFFVHDGYSVMAILSAVRDIITRYGQTERDDSP